MQRPLHALSHFQMDAAYGFTNLQKCEQCVSNHLVKVTLGWLHITIVTAGSFVTIIPARWALWIVSSWYLMAMLQACLSHSSSSSRTVHCYIHFATCCYFPPFKRLSKAVTSDPHHFTERINSKHPMVEKVRESPFLVSSKNLITAPSVPLMTLTLFMFTCCKCT